MVFCLSYFLLPLKDFSLRNLQEECRLLCRLLWGASQLCSLGRNITSDQKSSGFPHFGRDLEAGDNAATMKNLYNPATTPDMFSEETLTSLFDIIPVSLQCTR